MEVGSGEPVLFVSGERGHRPNVGVAVELAPDYLAEEELRGPRHPVLMFYGTGDPVGSVDVWRRFVDHLPEGELEVFDDVGLVPLLDDPAGVGRSVDRFLRRA